MAERQEFTAEGLEGRMTKAGRREGGKAGRSAFLPYTFVISSFQPSCSEFLLSCLSAVLPFSRAFSRA
jgi:hypothetical protein